MISSWVIPEHLEQGTLAITVHSTPFLCPPDETVRSLLCWACVLFTVTFMVMVTNVLPAPSRRPKPPPKRYWHLLGLRLFSTAGAKETWVYPIASERLSTPLKVALFSKSHCNTASSTQSTSSVLALSITPFSGPIMETSFLLLLILSFSCHRGKHRNQSSVALQRHRFTPSIEGEATGMNRTN